MNKLIIPAVIASGLLFGHSPEALADGAKYKSHRTSINLHYNYRGAYRGDRKYSRSRNYNRYAYKRNQYRNYRYSPSYYRVSRTPSWLRHDRSFRRWYNRTQWRIDHRLSWHELFDIYRWERRYDRRYRH